MSRDRFSHARVIIMAYQQQLLMTKLIAYNEPKVTEALIQCEKALAELAECNDWHRDRELQN